ncbi:hypothetical protein NO2_1222 [Candidatus Termititenax persephonae]|uniref:FlgD Ig-like domain-containing protein n=1 Tax=Candidatus Termititenax persephonae TaxID=2218525 RepID=A0A388TIS2_9BACT|nr:hypothetical protein NO2_1222 [Candidatus Termititenax persephonae]
MCNEYGGDYSYYTDIVLDTFGNIGVAVVYGNNRKIRFFYIDPSGSFVEDNSSSGYTYFVPDNYLAYIPSLSTDSQGDFYLAFDLYDSSFSSGQVKIYKRSSGGSWTLYDTMPHVYMEQYVNIAHDQFANLHVVYSKQDSAGSNMQLIHRSYDSTKTLFADEVLANKLEIYSPHIGFTTANIPVIQFIESNNSNSADYSDNRIMQISQRSPTVWSEPQAVSGYGAVFAHMAPNIQNDQPDTLWFDPVQTKVFFNENLPDLIAPWQPDAPSVVWEADQSPLNSTDNQTITASIAALPTRSAQVQYNYFGVRGNTGLAQSAWTTGLSDARASVYDRQQVDVAVRARDNATPPNISEWSATVSVQVSDRTPPVSNRFSINAADPQYASSNSVSLQLGAADPAPGSTQVSFNSLSGVDTQVSKTFTSGGTDTLSAVLSGSDGTRTVTGRYYDASGNYIEVSDTIDLDTQNPSSSNFTLANATASGYVGGLIARLSITPEDTTKNGYQSGIDTIVVEATGLSNQVLASNASSLDLTFASTGAKTVTLNFYDKAGNQHAVVRSMELYNGSLVTTFNSGVTINSGAVYTNNSNVLLSLGSDGAASMNVKNDENFGLTWDDYAAHNNDYPWVLSGGDGEQKVYARYRDVLGNEALVSDSIYVDTQVPSGSFSLVNSVLASSVLYVNDRGGVSLNLKYQDRLNNSYASGVAQALVSVNNGTFGANQLVLADTTTGDTLGNKEINIAGLSYGTNTVTVRYIDSAGNTYDTAVLEFYAVSNNPKISGEDKDDPPPSPGTEQIIRGAVTINNGDALTYDPENARLSVNALTNGAPLAKLKIVTSNIDYGVTQPTYQELAPSFAAATALDYPIPSLAAAYPHQLGLAHGTRNVFVMYIDVLGNTSNIAWDDIFVNTVPLQGIGLEINGGAAYTFSPTVNLLLTANDTNAVLEIWLSNEADFSSKTILSGWQDNYYPWELKNPAVNGKKTVYARFFDHLGNFQTVSDVIGLNLNGKPLEIIEPDGIDDVASNNFTISWIEHPEYIFDQAAEITILYEDRQNPGTYGLVSEHILYVDDVNGVIWDTSALPSGTYDIYAVISDHYGAATINAAYPVYVDHSGTLPADPPAVLVIEPSADVPAGQPVRVVWLDETTPGDGSIITIYYDNDTNTTNGRILLTTNILADDPADYLDLLPNDLPMGEWYICVEISNDDYVRYDYSSGKITVPDTTAKPEDNSGGTNEPVYSYPNPFSPRRGEEAQITFKVKESDWVKVYIYNIRGERIWQQDVFAVAGQNNLVAWDGRNTRGQLCGNGIYLVLFVNHNKKILMRGRLTLYD